MKRFNLRGKLAGGVALAATVIMGISPMTAYATAGLESETVCIVVNEESINEEEERMGPLTPAGNLTLVDDYGSADKVGKQFITVVTKAGNYFYIVIDRDDSGNETVHFLNMVDEADLLSLMDDEEAKKYIDSVSQPKITEPEVIPKTEITPEPTETPSQEETADEMIKSNESGLLLLVVLVVLGGIGGFFFLKKNKEKGTQNIGSDPDFDYNEDEDDYLAELAEDEDIASEFEEDNEE